MQRKYGLSLPGSDIKRVLFFVCVNFCFQVVSCGDGTVADTGSATPDWGTPTAGYVELVTVCGQRNSSICDDSAPETMTLKWEQTSITSKDNTAVTTPGWHLAIGGAQLAISVTGGVANILTFVTLQANGRSFSRMTVFLLKHQALIDAAVCIFATVGSLQTSMSHAGVYVIDLATCFLWYNQYFYWVSVFLSVWNLVLIAFDRLLAVCFPIRYTMASPLHLKVVIPIMYVFAMASNYPGFFLVHFVDGHCLKEPSIPIEIHMKLFHWHSIYWLFIISLIPMAMLSFPYGCIVLKLRRRLTTVASVSQSKAISKSTMRVTKCAVTVTVIFIVISGYHSIVFFIAMLGLVSIDFGGPVPVFGMMLIVVNSFTNPFIYIVYMPSFRRSLLATFCRRGNAVQDETSRPIQNTQTLTCRDQSLL